MKHHIRAGKIIELAFSLRLSNLSMCGFNSVKEEVEQGLGEGELKVEFVVKSRVIIRFW